MATISNNASENSQVGLYSEYWNKWAWQTFTMPSGWTITSIEVKHLYDWVWFSHNSFCNVYATSWWVPTGDSLWSKTAALSWSDTTLTYTFATPISVNSGTMYAFVINTRQYDTLWVWNWSTFANWTWVKYTPWSWWATNSNDVAWFTITYTEIIWPANLKTLDTNTKSNTKTIDWNPIANVKTWDSIT